MTLATPFASTVSVSLRQIGRDVFTLVAPSRELVLDLGDIHRMDTRSARILLDLSRRLEKAGGILKLQGIQRQVLLVLELLRLHRTIEIRVGYTPAARFVPAMAA